MYMYGEMNTSYLINGKILLTEANGIFSLPKYLPDGLAALFGLGPADPPKQPGPAADAPLLKYFQSKKGIWMFLDGELIPADEQGIVCLPDDFPAALIAFFGLRPVDPPAPSTMDEAGLEAPCKVEPPVDEPEAAMPLRLCRAQKHKPAGRGVCPGGNKLENYPDNLEKVPSPTINRTQSQTPQDKMQNGFMFCVFSKRPRQGLIDQPKYWTFSQKPSQLDNSNKLSHGGLAKADPLLGAFALPHPLLGPPALAHPPISAVLRPTGPGPPFLPIRMPVSGGSVH